MLKNKSLGEKGADQFLVLFQRVESIFGIIHPEEIPEELRAQGNEIERLRAEKKWNEADKIRKDLTEQGYLVDNALEGTIIIRLPRS